MRTRRALRSRRSQRTGHRIITGTQVKEYLAAHRAARAEILAIAGRAKGGEVELLSPAAPPARPAIGGK